MSLSQKKSIQNLGGKEKEDGEPDSKTPLGFGASADAVTSLSCMSPANLSYSSFSLCTSDSLSVG